MKIRNYFWKRSSMKNITGTFMGIQRSLLSCLACSLAAQSFVAFCAFGILGTENISTSKNSGINANRFFQDTKV
ncbi:hypothetical protein Cfor_07626 [Coptotermes formosanus]|uniref:Uncharacterized protein n=1 Tax=Coptotermes formosanus TaxID=36987 RepID=A0A6L2PJ79_COPFO|nr:hypothetical protein Cfor_07626 [Coptotermes formosanus]